MNSKRLPEATRGRALERGYSMIELSVALMVALFLLTGMFTILQGTRNTSQNQNLLAQLQDEERVAMTMMADVVQLSGYFPNASTIDPTTALPTSTAFTTAGQAIAGTTDSSGNDSVSVRYQGDSTNSVFDCQGTTIGNGTLEEMTFSIAAGPNNSKQLICTVNNNPIPLVQNVTSMTVLYGVDANGSGSPNAYLSASNMTGLWANVYTVKLTLTFTNPLYGQPGQTAAAAKTISFSRVIGIMSRAGANAANFY